MHIAEAKKLCWVIKDHIQWNNDRANYARVRELKAKRRLLKKRILNALTK